MSNIYNKLCDYGCGNNAKYYFKYVKKYCCAEHYSKCPSSKIKNRMTQLGIKRSANSRKNISKGKKKYYENPNNRKIYSEAQKNRYMNMSNDEKLKLGKKVKGEKNGMFGKKSANRLTISKIKKKYLIFSKIEEMRYNPYNPDEKEIQVHCKNHNCPNSKEQGGWFTPHSVQLYERIRNIELHGLDNSYFYCSVECKNECPLYGLQNDLFNNIEKVYTQVEYIQFKKYVLERDNHICQYCGKKAEHVHHERPQKLEPFFSLDPDLAWSVCEKCHYKYGHKDECSTGILANTICFDNK